MDYLRSSAISRIVWRTIQTRIFDKTRPKICHTPIFQLKGQTKRSNHDLSIIVFAVRELAEYFSKLIYAEEPEIKLLGKTTYQDIPLVIANSNPDIALVNASGIFSEFLLSNRFFILPYIDFTLDVSDSLDSILAGISRKKRKRIREIEKLGYTYEITKDSEKLKSFYNEMYVPRILNRHGKSAQTVCFSECQRLFRSGGLLLVELDGKYISGAIYVPHGNELYIPMLGISKIDEYLTRGGHAALYFLILWAKQQGYEKIDYSFSNPFLKDGIFQYKKEWGMKIRPIKGRDAKIFAIKLCNFREGTQDFLKENPFICTDGEDLKGLVVLDSNIRDWYNTYYVPGLSGLIVLSLIRYPPRSQLTQLHKFPLKDDFSQISLPLSFLTEIASERVYDVYHLDFNNAHQKNPNQRE